MNYFIDFGILELPNWQEDIYSALKMKAVADFLKIEMIIDYDKPVARENLVWVFFGQQDLSEFWWHYKHLKVVEC